MKKLIHALILASLIAIIIIISSACDYSSVFTKSNFERSHLITNCLSIQHYSGETCVPKNPQRIVTLHPATLGNVLTLGIKPIGSTTGFRKTDFPEYLADKLEAVESVGTVTQASLERIKKLQPDLIISTAYYAKYYSILSKIAPTVQDEWRGPVQWKEHFQFVTKVLGRENSYQQAWNDYEQRVKALKGALGDRYQNKKFSFVYLERNDIGMFISELKNVFAGAILNDVGLQRTEIQDVITPDGYLFIPIEKLPDIDGDYIFMGIYGNDDKSALERLQRSPLWQTLKAVQQNHVYFVNLSTWRESNLLAADAVLDDLEKYLINSPAAGSRE